MVKWNDDWREELREVNEDCYYRLCECRNTKGDILAMAVLVKKYNADMDAEDCLLRIVEWVCDWNNQYEIDLTEEEWNKFIKVINL